jgi:hypothetical protein
MGAGATHGLGRIDTDTAARPFIGAKAARARQVAEGVTTRAMKAKVLEDVGHCDRLVAKGDRAAEEAAGF